MLHPADLFHIFNLAMFEHEINMTYQCVYFYNIITNIIHHYPKAVFTVLYRSNLPWIPVLVARGPARVAVANAAAAVGTPGGQLVVTATHFENN